MRFSWRLQMEIYFSSLLQITPPSEDFLFFLPWWFLILSWYVFLVTSVSEILLHHWLSIMTACAHLQPWYWPCVCPPAEGCLCRQQSRPCLYRATVLLILVWHAQSTQISVYKSLLSVLAMAWNGSSWGAEMHVGSILILMTKIVKDILSRTV